MDNENNSQSNGEYQQNQYSQGQYQQPQGQYQQPQGQYQQPQGQYQQPQGQYQQPQGQYQQPQGQYQQPQGQYQQPQGQYQQPQGRYQQPQYQPQSKTPCTNTKAATTSFLLGLGTFFFVIIGWIAFSVLAANAVKTFSVDSLSSAYSICSIFSFLGVISGVAAIILSVIAKKTGYSGLATAGLVLAIIGIVICLISTVTCAGAGVNTQDLDEISDAFGNYY